MDASVNRCAGETVTADVPDAAWQLGGQLADAFEQDRTLAEQLNDAQHRLQAANGQLWTGLHPNALRLVYDARAAVGVEERASVITGRMIDALRSGLPAAEVEAAVLPCLQEAHWAIHRAFCDYQRLGEERRHLAAEIGDLDAGTVRVRHGKGDRSRTVGLDEQTTALLARWLDRRKKLAPGARAPIFCTLKGGRIDSSYIRRLLPRLARKAGIDRRVHAHGLRHTHAAELAREDTPINIIRDDLGHTNLAVTDRYLRDVAPQAVIDTLRARRWPSA
jgi:integrase